MILTCGLIAVAGAYAWCRLRARRYGRRVSGWAATSFFCGIAAIAGALLGPMDALSDASLSWHMVQHLALIVVAAPLLLLGMPVRVVLASLAVQPATRVAALLRSWPVRVLEMPAFGLGLLTVALYGTHFSPMYEAALQHRDLHDLEHGLYLTAALAYWAPIFARAPMPHASPHPARLLTLFLTIPMTAFLGFALYASHRVVYPHYGNTPAALADQMNAGAIMWLAAGTPMLLAILWCVADWGARERRLGRAWDLADGGG